MVAVKRIMKFSRPFFLQLFQRMKLSFENEEFQLESESKAPGEVSHFIGVKEQRMTGIVTFTLIGLSVFMTGVLGRIPVRYLESWYFALKKWTEERIAKED